MVLQSLAACGTSDKANSSASGGSSSSSSTTGYDVSGVKKDDDIAAMLPDSVTKDGKFDVHRHGRCAPANSLPKTARPPSLRCRHRRALANIFGLEADPETSNFDSIIPSVGSKYDIGISHTITKGAIWRPSTSW